MIGVVGETREILVELPGRLEGWGTRARNVWESRVEAIDKKREFDRYEEVSERLYTACRPGEITPGCLVGRYCKENLPWNLLGPCLPRIMGTWLCVWSWISRHRNEDCAASKYFCCFYIAKYRALPTVQYMSVKEHNRIENMIQHRSITPGSFLLYCGWWPEVAYFTSLILPRIGLGYRLKLPRLGMAHPSRSLGEFAWGSLLQPGNVWSASKSILTIRSILLATFCVTFCQNVGFFNQEFIFNQKNVRKSLFKNKKNVSRSEIKHLDSGLIWEHSTIFKDHCWSTFFGRLVLGHNGDRFSS